MLIRSALLTLACAAALGCASIDAPAQDSESWKSTWKERASAMADGAAAGAKAVGSSFSTAASGVAKGFDDPDSEAFGAYPRDYPRIIQTHLLRFEDIPRKASLRFARPVRGYINKGLFQGGGIAWQGYLVDVTVAIPSRFEGQGRELAYTVRMRDGEVIEVHDARYASSLKRVEAAGAPSALADGTPH